MNGGWRAVDWFGPERGLRLSTYATWWICQGVQRGLRNRGRAMISLPVHGGNRVAKAHAAHATLSAELGRDTGTGAEELAVRLG
jgi:RNA polymerase primary sigma factor